MLLNINKFVCDKCGEEVAADNNAVNLEAIRTNGNDLFLIFAQPRHLIATDNCPGSPSRAQYLEGQPKDERTQWAYDEKYEESYREAYKILKESLQKS